MAIALRLFEDTKLKSTLVKRTFRDSRALPVHRWYPYVEGFSSTWVLERLEEFGKPGMIVYDPFGGCGTTQLEASKLGLDSAYCEINPFMSFVCNTKVNATLMAVANIEDSLHELRLFRERVDCRASVRDSTEMSLTAHDRVLLDQGYFEERHLKHLVYTRDQIALSDSAPHVNDMLELAVASVAIDCSNMTRRADLRRRRADEYIGRIVDVQKAIIDKLDQMIADLEHLPHGMRSTIQIGSDARMDYSEMGQAFDLAITSPPYLNGTNYIRNSQIELWLTRMVSSPEHLSDLKRRTVCGGISDAVKSRMVEVIHFDFVEEVARELDTKGYDTRIPLMVRSYFSDMFRVFVSVHSLLKAGALFILDIGDSKFCGVHIPTDRFLERLARLAGFEVQSNTFIADRYSRDKTRLIQVELRLLKPHK